MSEPATSAELASPAEPVLHHYPESPYAEKIRAILGYKGLAWRSVLVPRIAPKPDLVALTGGYRKVPVLQIGADVYCDTRLIAEELERRYPAPSLATGPGSWAEVVGHWVDVRLFAQAVGYTFGRNVDRYPDVFLADRAALRGAPLERGALKGAVPLIEQELRAQLAWVEQGLSGGVPFINGSHPAAAEFTLYSTLWFARGGGFDFGRFPAIAAWMARMQAFGHGRPTEATAGEALAWATTAQPASLPEPGTGREDGWADAQGLARGQRVSVTPELLGHGTSVAGVVAHVDAARLTLKLPCPGGMVHVHFPRLGYRVHRLDTE